MWTPRVFVAASTVRNILLAPKPKRSSPQAAAARRPARQPRTIMARYPNHVWSVDRTRVWRWWIWPTWVLVAIDHYSRMVTTTCSLEGPNAGWVTTALESAFARYGAPKYMITDQDRLFTSGAFNELVHQWDVKQRFGAVGQHGSIAVTERVIWTLKHEWLNRVAIIRGLDHLSGLLNDFALYYDGYRGHMTLGGAPPAALHQGDEWHKPPRSAKTRPGNIERRLFPDVNVIAYRLAA